MDPMSTLPETRCAAAGSRCGGSGRETSPPGPEASPISSEPPPTSEVAPEGPGSSPVEAPAATAVADATALQRRARAKRPGVQLVRKAEDLARIEFVDDVAEIEVPIEAIDLLPFKNEDRSDSERLRRVENAIRRLGYNNRDPVVVRLGRRGRWVIVDGGHRVTAARHVAKELWTNLFRRKVRSIHFLLFRTPLSNTLIDSPAAVAGNVASEPPTPGTQDEA
jgi:hypothetical protein